MSVSLYARQARRGRARECERGLVLLTLLIALMLVSVALMGALDVWALQRQRQQEEELLFVGNQYRKAIERYVLAGKAQYPRTLEDLLKDPRQPSTQRYLRRLYPDPITGKNEWGLVKGPDGGIGGVYSLSEDKPFKSANFKLRDANLEGAQKYSDWKFSFTPAAQPATVKPAAGTK